VHQASEVERGVPDTRDAQHPEPLGDEAQGQRVEEFRPGSGGRMEQHREALPACQHGDGIREQAGVIRRRMQCRVEIGFQQRMRHG
jgi:hypothetical protein